MSAPLTPDALLKALRAEGLTVVEVGSWRTHNRNHINPFGPVHGVMMHHTAGPSRGAAGYCYSGSAELPGPLCHGVIDKDGVVYLTSAGRANHAGGGDPNVLAAVKDERYGDYPPATHQHQGTAGAVDGNDSFYGFECVNLGNGKDSWPEVQVDAMVRAGTAISRAYGWSEKSVIAHKEWSDYKPDPAGPGFPSMRVFRGMIAERLRWSPQDVPTTPQGPDMTAPFVTVLVRDQDATLTPHAHLPVYWDGEWADSANEHGAGGKTIFTSGSYVATLTVEISGLAVGETVEVYAYEENSNGEVIGTSPVHLLVGTGATVRQSVSLTGFTLQRMGIALKNRGNSSVVLDSAQVAVLHWNL